MKAFLYCAIQLSVVFKVWFNVILASTESHTHYYYFIWHDGIKYTIKETSLDSPLDSSPE